MVRSPDRISKPAKPVKPEIPVGVSKMESMIDKVQANFDRHPLKSQSTCETVERYPKYLSKHNLLDLQL